MIARIAATLLVAGCGRFGFQTSDGPSGPDLDATPTDTYSTAVLADHPIAYWRLDETTGTSAIDEVGGNTGTYMGGCTLGSPGALSSGDPAVALDGTSCRIVIGDVFEFAGTVPFSFDLWANIDIVDNIVRRLVDRGNLSGMDTGYQFPLESGTLWFEQDDSGASLSYVNTAAPTLHVFHHLALTTGPMRQRIYVDGAMVVQKPFDVTMPPSAGALVFGDYVREGDPNKFKGTLDEIAFYDIELSAGQIAAHYAAR